MEIAVIGLLINFMVDPFVAIDSLGHAAFLHYKRGEYSEAIKCYERILEIIASLDSVDISYQSGEGETAVDSVQRHPTSPYLYLTNTVSSSSFMFKLELPADCEVFLKVYNASGRLVQSKKLGLFKKGVTLVRWDPQKQLPSGLYFVVLYTNTFKFIRKVLLIKQSVRR